MINKYDALMATIEAMQDYEVIDLHNQMCEGNNYMDDYIYDNDIDELLCGKNKPSEVVNELHEDYNINDNYAVFTIYGLNSFSYLGDENSPIDYDEIVNYILDNDDDCGYSEIAEILEEEEDEEE